MSSDMTSSPDSPEDSPELGGGRLGSVPSGERDMESDRQLAHMLVGQAKLSSGLSLRHARLG